MGLKILWYYGIMVELGSKDIRVLGYWGIKERDIIHFVGTDSTKSLSN